MLLFYEIGIQVCSFGMACEMRSQVLFDLFEHLESELDRSGYLRVLHKRPAMIRNLRNIFLRTGLTSQEVRTLRGVISSLVNPYYKRD